MSELIFLCGFPFLAGFIDAVAGGGGLVQVPALFVLMPGVPAATLLGTNKFASIWGTVFATWQYSRQMPMEWRATLPTCGTCRSRRSSTRRWRRSRCRARGTFTRPWDV